MREEGARQSASPSPVPAVAFTENEQISWAGGVSDLMLELFDSTEHVAPTRKLAGIASTHLCYLMSTARMSEDANCVIAWKRSLVSLHPISELFQSVRLEEDKKPGVWEPPPSAVRYAAGRPARKTNGSALAVMSGIPSMREAVPRLPSRVD